MIATHQSNHPILVVGATGFIGHYVLAGLLKQKLPCVAMLREPAQEATDRLVSLLAPLGLDVPMLLRTSQLQLLHGDINHHLPMAGHLQINTIVHAAGITAFEPQPNGDPHRTNVLGTAKLLNWADAHHMNDFHLVSSAYQCGLSTCTAPETLVTDRPHFVNDYERSKWDAEQLASAWSTKPGRTLTIYRPSIVIGDQTEGRTTSYSGFYLMARATELLWQWYEQSPDSRLATGLQIQASPVNRQNFVPVDHVADAIVHAITHPQWHGKIFHLTHPSGTSNAVVKQALDEHFGFAGSDFTNGQVTDDAIQSDAHRLFHNATRVLRSYLRHCPAFDRTNARQLEASANLVCPDVDVAYLDQLITYARATRWGKRTQPQSATALPLKKVNHSEPLQDHLIDLYFQCFLPQKVSVSKIASMTALTTSMRFVIQDVHEGQWHCHFDKGRLTQVQRGVHSDSEAFTYTTSSQVFWQAIAGELDPQEVFLRDLATIQGDMESAIKMIMILHQFNREFPCSQNHLMQLEASLCKAS